MSTQQRGIRLTRLQAAMTRTCKSHYGGTYDFAALLQTNVLTFTWKVVVPSELCSYVWSTSSTHWRCCYAIAAQCHRVAVTTHDEIPPLYFMTCRRCGRSTFVASDGDRALISENLCFLPRLWFCIHIFGLVGIVRRYIWQTFNRLHYIGPSDNKTDEYCMWAAVSPDSLQPNRFIELPKRLYQILFSILMLKQRKFSTSWL